MSTDLGFTGEVAGFYHRYRHGYPSAVIDILAGAVALTGADLAVDLGCGTGQLAVPLASRAGAVLGVDPEPDMLAWARRFAAGQGVANASWLLGADTDLPALAALLGGRRAALVSIGQALHWMDYRTLIPALAALLRPGGAIAVISNGTPMWLQDSPWSRALREFLEQWQRTTLTATCGTDEQSRQRYRETMAAAGLELTEASHDYATELDLDHVIGALYSAMSPKTLPAPEQRAAFTDQLGAALAPHAPFIEQVPVRILLAQLPTQPPHPPAQHID